MGKQDIRLLLVDDEKELVEYLSRRLLREGFTVRATFSGEDAVEVAEKESFNVAIVDLKMPGYDGIETQKKLKERCPYMEAIVLTGHGSLESALESGKQGAFLFLEKPVEHGALVQAIRQAADKKEEELHGRFRAELAGITRSNRTPREILQAIESLRKKYNID